MTNKYLIKLAEHSANDEYTHGDAIYRGSRAAGRALLESIGSNLGGATLGGLVGGGLGAMAGGRRAAIGGAMAGAVTGGSLGGILGALHGTGRSVQNQIKEQSRMQTKQASTRLGRFVYSNSLPGSGKAGHEYLGSRALNEAYTGASPTASVLSGGTRQEPIKGLFTGRVKGTRTVANDATRVTGDVLARQPSLQERLAIRKSGNAIPSTGPRPNIPGAKPVVGNIRKPAAPTGILQRALGFARKNPLLAAGGALAGGVVGGTLLGKSMANRDQYSGGYPQQYVRY